jgi:hypothetical protein
MDSQSSLIHIAAIRMVLQHPAPGIVMINEEMPSNIPPQLMPVVNSSDYVHFIAAADVEHPTLRQAIASCNFSQYRLMAEDGKCYVVAIEELEKTLVGVE